MEEFKEIIFDSSRSGRRLQANEASIVYNREKKSYGFTFNQEVSKEIFEQGFTRVKLIQSQFSNDLFLVIGETGSLPISRTGMDEKGNFNFRIQNRNFIEFLHKTFNLSSIRTVINIGGNIANRNDIMTFRLSINK